MTILSAPGQQDATRKRRTSAERGTERETSFGDLSFKSESSLDGSKWKAHPPVELPFIVHVRVAIKRISKISTVDRSAFIAFGIVFYWTDPRLIGWDEDDDLPSQLWVPKLLCRSKEDGFQAAPDGVHLIDSETGRLKRGYNYDGFVVNPFENDQMATFPFDFDGLDVVFYTESNWETPDGSITGLSPKQRVYKFEPVVPDTGEGKFWFFGWDGSIDEWRLHGSSFKIETHPPTASGAMGSSLKLKFHISRDPHFYEHKVILPLLLLGLMQFWVYALPTHDVSDRLALCSTIWALLFAFVFITTSFVPKLNFLTHIDRAIFFLMVIFFVHGCVVVFFGLIHCEPATFPSRDICSRAELICIAVLGVIFVMTMSAIFVPCKILHNRGCRALDSGRVTAKTPTMEEGFVYTPNIARPQAVPVWEMAQRQAKFARKRIPKWALPSKGFGDPSVKRNSEVGRRANTRSHRRKRDGGPTTTAQV